MRLKKSPPPRSDNPRIHFASQCDVLTLSQLFAEHRGKQRDTHRFHGLIYAFLIYDYYAAAYNHSRNANEAIGRSWRSLSQHQVFVENYRKIQPWSDQGRLDEIAFNLPIVSASPIHNNTAPHGINAGTYTLPQLTPDQFIQTSWLVRCNLLHGSYDPNNEETWLILRNMSRVFCCLVWEILKETQPQNDG